MLKSTMSGNFKKELNQVEINRKDCKKTPQRKRHITVCKWKIPGSRKKELFREDIKYLIQVLDEKKFVEKNTMKIYTEKWSSYT